MRRWIHGSTVDTYTSLLHEVKHDVAEKTAKIIPRVWPAAAL
ncbi:MAG: hypothetical protein ACRDT8_05485 [Micromonosporaceae bacterium]